MKASMNRRIPMPTRAMKPFCYGSLIAWYRSCSLIPTPRIIENAPALIYIKLTKRTTVEKKRATFMLFLESLICESLWRCKFSCEETLTIEFAFYFSDDGVFEFIVDLLI